MESITKKGDMEKYLAMKIRLLVDADTGEVFEFDENKKHLQRVGSEFSDMIAIRNIASLNTKQQERKRLFQEVALRTVGKIQRMDGYELFVWDDTDVAEIANEILQASEEFAKETE